MMNRSHAHVVSCLHCGGVWFQVVCFDRRGRWSSSTQPMTPVEACKARDDYNSRMRRWAKTRESMCRRTKKTP
jgi:pimeloyl-ACP methyl ester carboxylesterase